MPQRAVVIGAGAVGIASAYYLQRSGFTVTVVDQGDVGRGCSYGNSCLIVPSHSEPLPGPGVIGQALRFLLSPTSPFYIRPRLDPALAAFCWQFRKYCNRESAERGFEALVGLSRASLALYQELTAAKEVDFYFRREGLLEVYLTERGVGLGRHGREIMEQQGFPARLLSQDEALASLLDGSGGGASASPRPSGTGACCVTKNSTSASCRWWLTSWHVTGGVTTTRSPYFRTAGFAMLTW